MGRWRLESGVLIAASLLLEQGCLFKKEPRKASIVIPPAPQPAPPQPLAAPPQLPPSQVQDPPQSAQEMPTLPPPVTLPKPVRPRPVRRPAVGTNPGPPAPEGQLPPIEVPSVVPAPTLQPILGSQEIAERTRRINVYLDKARLSVVRAERANPGSQQKELIGQVRTFLQQAEEARKVDLVRAENLAERAEVLSRSLLK